MKTLLTTLCLTIAVLLGSVGVSFSADFQKGLTADKSGDYRTEAKSPPAKLVEQAKARIFTGKYGSQWFGVMTCNYPGKKLKYDIALRIDGKKVFIDNGPGKVFTVEGSITDSLWSAGYISISGGNFYYDLNDYVWEMKGQWQETQIILRGALSREDVSGHWKPTPFPCKASLTQGVSEITEVARENFKIFGENVPPSPSAADIKNEKLRKKIARLEKEKQQNQSKPKQVAKKTPQPTPEPKLSTSGSGFFVSKSGHVITNQHVIDDCNRVSVGDNAKKQVTADVLETDRRNDLALLKISSLKMASVETKSLIQKLGIKIVPLASDGLLRSEDVDLGEKVLVAGYPYGEMFSNSIKVTGGMVSANRGLGDDTGQFQMDAAVQPGNSGGPIYDENGNIVGVVVAQLNKMKFAKESGSMPENVNFGIKASTVRQFLSSSGLPTKWSKRSKVMSTRDLAKIAKRQTVMVMCHQ